MKSLKTLARNNQLANKYLTIKNIILDKLNAIIYTTQHSDEQAKQKFQEIQETNDLILVNSRLILENQVFLLKSSIETVDAVRQSIIKADSTLNELKQSIRSIVDESMIKSESALNDLRQSIGSIADESLLTHQAINQIYQLVGESYKAAEKPYQELANIRQEVTTVKQENLSLSNDTRQLLGQICDNLHNQKFKLVTDPSHFQEIEIELMVFLYSYLPHRRAIDVGANRGDVSVRLLQTGYEVYAFEPFPPVLHKLKERLGNNPNFHALSYALGAVNEIKDLHLAVDQTEDKIYDDTTFYSTLAPHSLAEGLIFNEVIPVDVKSLASLHETGEVPCQVGLVKIDAEGFDLEVIKGMGDFRYPVVLAEFWDPSFPFGKAGAMNYLRDMVPAMQQRGYSWHITIYRIWGRHDISYYCNSMYSFDNSWGNVIFFQDYEIFSEALKWCNATMPATYFAV
jgi:FkbM family methyltransferase